MSTTTAGISPGLGATWTAGSGRPVTRRAWSSRSSTLMERPEPMIRLPVQRRPHQAGHEAVLVGHPLPVDVGEPQRAGRHAVGAGVAGQQHLAGRLGGAVGGERAQGNVLVDGGVADVY